MAGCRRGTALTTASLYMHDFVDTMDLPKPVELLAGQQAFLRAFQEKRVFTLLLS